MLSRSWGKLTRMAAVGALGVAAVLFLTGCTCPMGAVFHRGHGDHDDSAAACQECHAAAEAAGDHHAGH